MSVSLATKVGAAGTITAGGGVAGTYLAWDHITLYEIERKVLKEESLLDVNVTANKPTIFFLKAGSTTYTKENSPWTCTISIKTGVSIASDSKLKAELPTEDTHKTNKKKQENKRKLVKACSSKRDNTSNSEKVTSTLELATIDSEDKLIEFLFGAKTTPAT